MYRAHCRVDRNKNSRVHSRHLVSEIIEIITRIRMHLCKRRRDEWYRTRGENEKGGRRENSKPRAAHAMTLRFAETWTHRWLPTTIVERYNLTDKMSGGGGRGGWMPGKRYKTGRTLAGETVVADAYRVRFLQSTHLLVCVFFTCIYGTRAYRTYQNCSIP